MRRFAVGDCERERWGTEERGARNLKFETEERGARSSQRGSGAAYACKKPGFSGQRQLLPPLLRLVNR